MEGLSPDRGLPRRGCPGRLCGPGPGYRTAHHTAVAGSASAHCRRDQHNSQHIGRVQRCGAPLPRGTCRLADGADYGCHELPRRPGGWLRKHLGARARAHPDRRGSRSVAGRGVRWSVTTHENRRRGRVSFRSILPASDPTASLPGPSSGRASACLEAWSG